MGRDKSVAEQTADQMLQVYHELAPVEKAYATLLDALETYQKKTNNWPPVHLGMPHYKHALEEITKHRKEVIEASHILRHALVDKKPYT